MRTAVLDIGSNSVRLLLSEDGKRLYKLAEVTALSEGLEKNGFINKEAEFRTTDAFVKFVSKAKRDGAEKIYAFGTEALRKAENAALVAENIYNLSGVKVEIISGKKEAELALMGALKGGKGGVIDVGGASAEVTLSDGQKIIYAKSLPIGIVRIKDYSLGNREKAEEFAKLHTADFNDAKELVKDTNTEFMAVGGTATQLAAIALELEDYDPLKVNGFVFTYDELKALSDKLVKMTPCEIAKLKGASEKRSSTIGGGSVIIKNIMQVLNLNKITVSEDDNLDGYLVWQNALNSAK